MKMNQNDEALNRNKKSTLSNTKYIVLTGMFTAILCVMAQLEIPVQPIPFTLAVFAVYLIGALLPPRYALMSVLAYILLGAFGLPVFAGLKSGFQTITGVTGGYIMAYPIMAFLSSLFYNMAKKYKVVFLTIGMLLSLFLCYLIGSLWFMRVTGNSMISALTLCVFPYIPFDLMKIVLAITLSTVLRKAVLRHI